MARLAVCLAVVLLAGCGSLSGSPTEVPATADSLTPAPVPTDTRTDTPPDRPPGLTALLNGERVGARDLARVHRQRLRNRSYRLTYNRTITSGSETLRRTRVRARVAPGGDTYRLVRTENTGERYGEGSASVDRLAVYQDEFAGWSRRGVGTDIEYDSIPPRRGGPDVDLTRADDVVTLLTAFQAVIVEEEMSPFQVTYRVRSVRVDNQSTVPAPAGLTDPRQGRLTMIVTSEGMVRSYDLTYRARFDGELVRVSQQLSVVERGRETVDPPGWLVTARGETTSGPENRSR